MLTKNCIPMPAYFTNSLLVSFLDFKIQFIFDATVNFPISFKVVKNNLASTYIGILAQNNRIFKIILQKKSSYQ